MEQLTEPPPYPTGGNVNWFERIHRWPPWRWESWDRRRHLVVEIKIKWAMVGEVSIKSFLPLSPLEEALCYWLVPWGNPAGLYTVLLSLFMFPSSLWVLISRSGTIDLVPPSPPPTPFPVPTIYFYYFQGINKEIDSRLIDLLPIAAKYMPKQPFLMLVQFYLS